MKKPKNGGPQFVRWFSPVVIALHELGGSGSVSEVIARITKNENVPESVQQERLKGGGLRFYNQVQFARQYLVWEGLVESSERGVWALTEKGQNIKSLAHDKALEIFKVQHAAHKSKSKRIAGSPPTDDENEVEDEQPQQPSYRQAVLERLRRFSPKGFENFCKRLLREYGFEKLEVTGGPKDKGIDGNGILKINPFVSFRVAFQCKRYGEAVVSSAISTFRGSIPSSVDKGILLTTGYFTADAKTVAQDIGLKPIELVDGEQLVTLMEEMELGLKPTFSLDERFFEEFD